MKDIRMKSKIVEPKSVIMDSFYYSNNKIEDKKRLGKFMLVTMMTSMFIYLFFVTSSIFYAINIQSYAYDIDELNMIALEIGYDDSNKELITTNKLFSIENKKEKISYINRNMNTTVSLK